MTMITPSYLGETIEYSSLHACRSTLEDPTGHQERGAAGDLDFDRAVVVGGESGDNHPIVVHQRRLQAWYSPRRLIAMGAQPNRSPSWSCDRRGYDQVDRDFDCNTGHEPISQPDAWFDVPARLHREHEPCPGHRGTQRWLIAKQGAIQSQVGILRVRRYRQIRLAGSQIDGLRSSDDHSSTERCQSKQSIEQDPPRFDVQQLDVSRAARIAREHGHAAP